MVFFSCYSFRLGRDLPKTYAEGVIQANTLETW